MLHVSFLNLLRALILSIIFFKKKFLAIILLGPELALYIPTLFGHEATKAAENN